MNGIETIFFQFYKRSSYISIQTAYKSILYSFNSIRDLLAGLNMADIVLLAIFQFYKRSSSVEE